MQQLLLKRRGRDSEAMSFRSSEYELESKEVKKAINLAGKEEQGLSIYAISQIWVIHSCFLATDDLRNLASSEDYKSILIWKYVTPRKKVSLAQMLDFFKS